MPEAIVCIDVASTSPESISAVLSYLVGHKCPVKTRRILMLSEDPKATSCVALPLNESSCSLFERITYVPLLADVSANSLVSYVLGYIQGSASSQFADGLYKLVRPRLGALGSMLSSAPKGTPQVIFVGTRPKLATEKHNATFVESQEELFEIFGGEGDVTAGVRRFFQSMMRERSSEQEAEPTVADFVENIQGIRIAPVLETLFQTRT